MVGVLSSGFVFRLTSKINGAANSIADIWVAARQGEKVFITMSLDFQSINETLGQIS